jgi:hypothetical protein
MRLLSVYLVPIGVLLVSVLAYVSWNSHYVASGDVVLPIRVLAEAGAPLDPATALRELAQTPAVERYDTHLSEAPVWFALRTQDLPGAPHIVEFPSRHAIDISCWDAASLVFLGSASHEATTGALSAAKAGFVLRPRYTPSEVLCRAHFTGPGAPERRAVAGQRDDAVDPAVPPQVRPARRRHDRAEPVRPDHRADQPPAAVPASSRAG